VSLGVKPPTTISFELISFICYHPTTNEFAVSHCEMGLPDQLLCTSVGISRRRPSSTNEVPVNFVRVVDRGKENEVVELDLLLRIASADGPTHAHYVRRSFRFTYHDGWIETE
jgi:hypothetical protein